MSTSTQVYVTIGELTMPEYQRNPHQMRVNQIAKSFNPDALGAITIARRPDGTLVVIDGGHRVAAAKECEYAGKLLAIQYEGLSVAEEAQMFLELNNSKLVSAVDKFKAAVIAKDERAMMISNVLADFGWVVSQGNHDGNVAAVTAINQVCKSMADEELLIDTFYVISLAWGTNRDAVHGELIKGVAKVLTRYKGEIKPKDLAGKLSAHLPRSIVTSGKGIASLNRWSTAAGVASTIVAAYNRARRGGRVQEWVWAR